jgi:pilus assembly protein Flp/PilA
VAQPLRYEGPWRGNRRAKLKQLRQRRTIAPHTAVLPRGRITMSMLIQYVKSFARNEEGQDLLEYALLVALIALVAIVAVEAAGGSVSAIFQEIADELAAPGA